VDVFPGPAEHSDPAAAVPPPRHSHLLAEGGFSLTAEAIAAPTGQAGPRNARISSDTFLELVPLLQPTHSPLSVTVADLGLPQDALKSSNQQDDTD